MRRLLLASMIALAACGRGGEREEGAPAPVETGVAGDQATPEDQAQAIAGDPRMLLFDMQTALEAVHDASGSYPTASELRLEERWALQRAALDAAFSSWNYESDGSSYRLTGTAAGRRFEVASPP